ncbi:DUF3906 family protein [Halalkalibacter alkaliphilus]|uniref:DUF3906 family protein n=1 Tax=Halalkalibacter alkaliphilus TaxID=2917993 RepID=A0A9X2CS06_9BACI|nr:DUF3906 family protein [Halalkalibacter alkaliphilus]MCL7747132.1 DUF3906 family protein [Halalkalibacter alkaliphilus]
MHLYRFDVEIEERGNVTVVVVAANEESAFSTAEQEVEKNYLKLPIITSITLQEKKPVGKTAGFVI